MRRMLAIVALVAIVNGIGWTLFAADTSADKFQIQLLEANFVEGIKAKDVDRVMSNYQNSPDWSCSTSCRRANTPDGSVQEGQGVLGGCKDARDGYDRFDHRGA